MIISTKYKYIFIAIHHTASTVIEEELCRNYAGERVRFKHSLPVLLPKWVENYKIIGGVRNPITDLIAQYNKYKNDHLGIYSEQIYGHPEHKFLNKRSERYFKEINLGVMSLDQYIESITKLPYVPRVSLNSKSYSYIYKMENLSSEFEKIIDHIGAKVVNSLPHKNRTNYSREIMDNIERLQVSPGVKVASYLHGYSSKKPSWSELKAYEAAKMIKTSMWRIDEIRKLYKKRELIEMQGSSLNEIDIG